MTEPFDELRQQLDRELKQLSLPRAPETLLPRVMAAVRVPVPWYRRPWLAWPVGWQAVSAILLGAVLASLALLIPAAERAFFPAVSGFVGGPPRDAVAVARKFDEASTLINVLWQMFLQPVAIFLLLLAVSISVAFGAIWTVLDRAVLGGASHQ